MSIYQVQSGRPEWEADRLPVEIAVYNILDQWKIPYARVDHAPAFTMEACAEINKALAPASICKNLFLCNAQKTKFYLLMMREDKRFVTKNISAQIGSSRLSFAPAEKMQQYLGCTPGSASVMGLMNDTERQVQLLVDTDVLQAEWVGCHPCINTTSLRLRTQDVFTTFLRAVGHTYLPVLLATADEDGGKPEQGEKHEGHDALLH